MRTLITLSVSEPIFLKLTCSLSLCVEPGACVLPCGAVIPIRRRTVKVVKTMNAGFIRYDRLQEIMVQHPSVLDRIRSFSKKRQKSEREKLAATKSSLLVPEKSDSSRVNPTLPTAPELQSPRFDLTKAMHQGMSEWDWRRRVDARLDKLVRHDATPHHAQCCLRHRRMYS